MTWRDRHVSRDSGLRIAGADTDAWISGEPAYALMRDVAEAVGGQVKIDAGAIEAFSQGDIGWGMARPAIGPPV